MGELLLKMSFAGAVLILVILVVRAILVNKLPKQTFLLLWLVAVLRLLLPFSIASDFSVYTLAERLAGDKVMGDVFPPNSIISPKERLNAAGVEYYVPTIQDDINLKGNIAENIGTGTGLNNGELSVRLIVWAAGALIVALYFVISYIHCYRRFQTALPVTNKYVMEWMDRRLGRKTGRKNGSALFRRSVSVRQSDRISTPLTYGILRPVILLPKGTDWNNRQQLRYVLLHEYAHICHWDALWKVVCVSVVCVHWFNPMVWMLYFFCNRDMELACDECVLRRLGEEYKSDYARTLIGMEEKKSAFLPVYSGFGKNAIQERIRAIMKIKKVSLGISLFCVALIVIVAVVFATSAKTKKRDEKSLSGEELSVETKKTEIPVQPEADLDKQTPPKEEYHLKFMLEGAEEEVPADLYTGAGYSILIPKEGWSMNAPDCWKSDNNDKVQIWIVHYAEQNLTQVTEELAAADYLPDESGNLFYRETPDDNLQFQSLREDGKDVWGVIYTYPDLPEFTEGFGARLPVIAASFQVLSGAKAQEGEVLSEDAREIQDVVNGFIAAYFKGDKEGVREYLTAPYEWEIVLCEGIETAPPVEIEGILGIGKMQVGDTCVISASFREPRQSDYLKYLTMELIKQTDGWKIYFYGIEG